MDQKFRSWIVLSILLSSLGVALILHYTRLIPGVGGDSVHYLMGAENLLDGNGYARLSGGGEIRPITGFPPFYSLVLAGVGLLKADLFQGARILNAILFGGSIFLVGLLIFRYTESLWAALIGSALILTSFSQVKNHGMIMSEPLFIFLMLLAVYTLILYLDSQSIVYLLLSGIMVSLATMTRYVGLSLLAAGGLSLLLLSQSSWRRRLADCMIYGGVIVAPFYLWLRRNAALEGTAVNRELIYHPMESTLLRVFLAEIASWFAPRILGLPRSLRNVLVIILTLPWITFFYLRELRDLIVKKDQPHKAFWTLPWVLALYVVSYIAILIVNSILLDASTTMSAPPRYLAPVFIAVVIIFVIAIYGLVEQWGRGRVLKIAAVLIGATMVSLYALQIKTLVREPFSAGGYFERKLKRPHAVSEFEALDPGEPIISNNPEMVYVFTNRAAYMWPILFDVYTLRDRDDYDSQIEATREKLLNGGVLVIFGWPEGTETLVFELLEAERFAHFIDVSFFGYPEVSQK